MHGRLALKDEKEDLFMARDIESLFIEGKYTNNII